MLDKINKKQMMIYLTILFFLEGIFINLLWGNEAKLTLILGIISIPLAEFLVLYMFSSVEKSIISIAFVIPLLPLSGYILLRLNLLDYQWLFYTAFYILASISLIKNKIYKHFDINNIILKNKIIRLSLFILLIVSCFFAYNKQLSFMIIFLSFIPFSIFFILIAGLNIKDKKKLLNNVFLSISVGCIVSSLPDILYFVLLWISGNKSARIFGPLGSNFILIYNLLIYSVLLAKWLKEKSLKNIWTILVLAMSMIISMQLSRGALLSFFGILIIFLIFDIKNYKKIIVIMIVFGSILGYNVMGRVDVAQDTAIQEIQEIVIGNKNEDLDINFGAPGDLLANVIKSQSKTRQVLWETGIKMSMDYKYTGVGIGNFKYFYQEYSGSDRPYLDAHNILLNMSSEIGMPFMILSFLFMLILGFGALINYFNKEKKDIRKNNIAIMSAIGVIMLYGNLTGIGFQTTNEVYSFTPTFIIIFMLFYRDYINEF